MDLMSCEYVEHEEGHVYVQCMGIYYDVSVLDFNSNYPNTVCTANVSP
jgi:DNA polymerase elongation subunit (family B)